ncbi:hypothetical protein GCM10023143_04740 [Compostibacter hankyongensis]|uniref:Putative beta-lactamase-inhibitor-like PepSY-like domain-containing protein n=2 Tax=Compostibacter hankyongensis TaxID=1007089 RepID=A0ABP8FF80_9BACT
MLFMLAAVTVAFGQKKARETAPAPVRNALKENFANASDLQWHRAADNWVAVFKTEEGPAQAEFTPEGTWVATRIELAPTQLPDTLMHNLQLQYPDATVKTVTHITRADIAGYYKIDVDRNGMAATLLGNEQGTLTE